jgi:hypothetical protein
VPREKAASARGRESYRGRFTFDKPAKLSKRREVIDRDFSQSMAIGSFQQFEQSYRGP